MKKDNTTLTQKLLLRKNLLKEMEDPVVIEAYGGLGRVFNSCYRDIKAGVVFEKDEDKAEFLARQRPTWAIYLGDCVSALQGGAGNHLKANIIDADPYGGPWDAIEAFFQSDREFPDKLGIVANDGLRQAARLNISWKIEHLKCVVEQIGNQNIYDNYLMCCRSILKEMAAQRGYALRRWAGYYCGYHNEMTHYAAVLER